MNKVFVMLAAILAGCPLAAQAGDETEIPKNEIEVRGFVKGDPTIRGYFETTITNKVSLNLSAFKTRGWDEVTVGPMYYITPEMSAGVGFGISRYIASNENTKSTHDTVSAFWYWKTPVLEAEILVERYSRDPKPWYQEGYAQRNINDNYAVGVFAAKDIGWGPRLSYSINKNTYVWASPLVHRAGNTTAILGAKVLF